MLESNTSFSHPSLEILTAAPDCVKVLSASGEIRFINARGLELLGARTADQVVGKAYDDLWPVAMHPSIHTAITEAAAGRHTQVEGFRRTLRGEWRWWEVHFHGVDGAENQREVICIARDLTARREREVALNAELVALRQQVAESEKRKTEFIATLAHELRNPLAPVRTGLQVLKESPGDPAAIERVRDIMERQVEQMVRLINDLLDIARLSSGKMELHKAPIDLKTIVMEAVEATAPVMTGLRHALNVEMPKYVIPLLADGSRLIQVFTNLLDNAAKYTAAGGHITVEVEPDGPNVHVGIADSGIGLSEEALEPIFEMFTSVGRDAAGLHVGLGIGLNLVRRLVQMHGGSVTAQSDGVGTGSRFIVTLPIMQIPATVSQGVQPLRHAEAVKIMLVDDNVDAATTMGMLLDYDHHTIRVVHTGADALEQIPAFKPDIVFLDIGMPHMNGYEVARAIRRMPEAGHPFLVALTGWGGAADRERTKAAGFDQHLTKPADLAAVEAMLHKFKRQ